MRVTINPDFYMRAIAGHPIAGNRATVLRKLCESSETVIAEVDGLAPYGWAGRVALPPGSYEMEI